MKTLDLFLLTNRVALVTGGRRGIGRAIAIAMAQAGADIAICDYADENGELEKLTADLKKMGRKCLTIRTDVSKSEQVQAMVQEVLAVYGKIDILVNNAGIGGEAAIPDLKEADWDAVIDTHLKGAYLCTQAVSAVMIAQKNGSIINIASVEGIASVRHASNAYPVAKAGIIMLTRGLAWDLGRHNIRVNAIAPGFVKTEMTRAMWDEESPAFKQWTSELQAQLGVQPGAGSLANLRKWLMARTIPLERSAEPEEIAAGALYLASDAASYVTGHTLVMDGGMLA
jgi:3-oxoacyl-[acyl-carrier protein] reductase